MKNRILEFCAIGYEDKAIDLISSGCDVNVSDALTKTTPGHLAAGYGLNRVLNALCSRDDWNPVACDINGLEPLDSALAQGKRESAEIIRQQIEKRGIQIHIISCVLRNDFDGVDAALEDNPSNINAVREGHNLSPLMAASGCGMEAMVDHLLAKPGINLDQKDNEGRTAVDHGRNFPQIVRRIMRSSNGGKVGKQFKSPEP